MLDRRLLKNFEWPLLLIIILIAAISIANLYSAIHPIGIPGKDILTKHIYWYIIGFCVMFIMMTFDYRLLESIAVPIYFFSIFLLVLVLITGKTISGSQRWLSIGGLFSFQPSEFTKLSLVIILAKFFSTHRNIYEYKLHNLWLPILLATVQAILVLKEPDLGTALLLLIIAGSIIFVMKLKWKSIFSTIILFIVSAPILWTYILKDYQKMRIMIFLRPEMDVLGAGYHINQSKITIGSGMLWGKGYLGGTQTHLQFLPEQHTDFIFSVLAEEWGFIGIMIIMSIFAALIIRGMFIAFNSKDQFGAILAVGITATIFWQLIINIGMVTGLLPVVGIPCTFLSYGGSSLVTTMVSLGLLMNISMRRFMFI